MLLYSHTDPLPPPLILPPIHTHTHTHTLTHTHTHTHTHTGGPHRGAWSASFKRSHTNSHLHTHTHTLEYTHIHTHSLLVCTLENKDSTHIHLHSLAHAFPN